jgi:CheY-like chemotaxis protein
MRKWQSRLLLIEDEAIVLLDLEETVTRFGYAVVGSASNLQQGLHLAQTLDFDAALLDLDLSGQRSTPIADVLASRDIPFIFVTGYDDASIPRVHLHRPRLAKPYDGHSLATLLSEMRRQVDGPTESAPATAADQSTPERDA